MKYRFFSNVAIALFLCLHLVAIVPRQNLAHERLRGFLDPIYDKAGWVQKPWDLFAPNPTRMNVRVLAVIAYEDGEVQTGCPPIRDSRDLGRSFVTASWSSSSPTSG